MGGGALSPLFSFLLWLFFLSVTFVLLHLSFFPFTSFSFVLSCCGCFLLWCPLSLSTCEIFSSLLKLVFCLYYFFVFV